ncbi:MAG: hypothetical protein WD078_02235 [Woeseia sp.]
MKDVSFPLLLIAALLISACATGAGEESGGSDAELRHAIAAADVVVVGAVGNRYFAGGGGAIGVNIHEVVKGEYKLGRTAIRWDRQYDAECQKEYLPDVEYVFVAKLIGDSLSISGVCQHVFEASDAKLDRVRGWVKKFSV